MKSLSVTCGVYVEYYFVVDWWQFKNTCCRKTFDLLDTWLIEKFYHAYLKCSDKHVWAYSVDQDQSYLPSTS